MFLEFRKDIVTYILTTNKMPGEQTLAYFILVSVKSCLCIADNHILYRKTDKL